MQAEYTLDPWLKETVLRRVGQLEKTPQLKMFHLKQSTSSLTPLCKRLPTCILGVGKVRIRVELSTELRIVESGPAGAPAGSRLTRNQTREHERWDRKNDRDLHTTTMSESIPSARGQEVI